MKHCKASAGILRPIVGTTLPQRTCIGDCIGDRSNKLLWLCGDIGETGIVPLGIENNEIKRVKDVQNYELFYRVTSGCVLIYLATKPVATGGKIFDEASTI